jgi:hypothetical protein
MLVLLIEGLYYVLVEMPSHSMIFLLTFRKIGTGVQAILRFCPRNLRGSNVGITNGKEL